MATVNTTSILGSDSISASRLTINSNFLLLQNWTNGFVSSFGIDTNNGILNLSQATTGSIYAKTGYFNQLQVPASGSFTARILPSGAATFSDIQTTSFTSSGLTTINGSLLQNGISTFGATATFNSGSTLNSNGFFVTGPLGSNTSKNTTYLTGLTAGQPFPDSVTLNGGGVITTPDSPYEVTGIEDVIYAECGPTGFYLSVNGQNGGSGGTPSILPSGYRIRIVNTTGSTGYIFTGVQGVSNTYYTGFNTDTSYGNYATGGIVIDQNSQYRASVHLQWEPRIAQGQTTQNGSWIVLSGTNVTI
jgi:hypothetical protein